MHNDILSSSPSELAETLRLWADEIRSVARTLEDIEDLGDDGDWSPSEQLLIFRTRWAVVGLALQLDPVIEAQREVLDEWR